MERFGTEPNPSLAVWLSQAQAPSTTKQAFDAPHTEIAPLKSTIGDQNYLLPRGLDPQKIRSVVVWNKPSRIAHTAATLRPQTRCIPRRDTAHPVSTPETSDP